MSQGQNPYQAPNTFVPSGRAVGVNSGNVEDLKKVAQYQKGIMYCILANITLFIVNIAAGQALSGGAAMMAGLVILGIYVLIAVAQLVCIVLLATQVYNLALGIVFGVLSFVPCLGLILLLVVNQKATSVLQQNGIKVGLMGADMSQLP
jgi:hypothetical protein